MPIGDGNTSAAHPDTAVLEAFQALSSFFSDPLLLLGTETEVLTTNEAGRRIGLTGSSASRLETLAYAPAELKDYIRACARVGSPLPGRLTLRIDGTESHWHCHGRRVVIGGSARPFIVLRLAPWSSTVSEFAALNLRIESLNAEIRRRRTAESELERQRKLLETTLDSIGDAVIVTDANARIRFINPVAGRLTGRRPVDVVGELCSTVFDIYSEIDGRAPESPVARVLREGMVVGLANHTILRRPDGSEIAIDDSGAPIIDPDDGSLYGVVLVFRDISEARALSRQLEERARMLEEVDRRKNEFIAMLSHELRNPLSAIGNALQVLAKKHPVEAADKRVMDLMQRQFRQLTGLVDQLLDVTRITRGQVRLDAEVLNLNAVLRDAIAGAGPAMEKAGHALHQILAEGPIWIKGDPMRLEQVFANLLDNAVKYTPAHGTIHVAGTLEDRVAVVSVRDTGIGIDPGMLDRIFGMFEQLDHSLARTNGGLGIGLTVARQLVEMHGGSLTAKSAGRGEGSEFLVRLPVVEAP
jgi:PAS domain S-box-containing protein